MKIVPLILVMSAPMILPVLAAQGEMAAYVDTLPGTRTTWEMIPVAAGTVAVPGKDGPVEVEVAPFWIGKTEVSWQMFDMFYLRLDIPRPEREMIDAAARPSRPYGAPDRGFGHRGWPAISVTHGAAAKFAEWLSEITGKHYAVATDAQWQLVANRAFAANSGIPKDLTIWAANNSNQRTHRVGRLAPDALGLHDLLGNAGEWVTGIDGTPWLRGGTFQDSLQDISIQSRARQAPSWNQTDPQIPKSRWWLSDGPFAGFRLVRIP